MAINEFLELMPTATLAKLEELARISHEAVETALDRAISERLDVQRWQIEQIKAAKAKADSGGKFVSAEAMTS